MNRRITVASAILATLTAAALAGPLAPTAGPVGPTMKTLTEVEPRTAVNAANTPGTGSINFRITQPGSYYLTSNITVLSTGIEITVSGVTLDLNGFTISGGTHAINAPSTINGLTIKNGSIKSTSSTGVRLFSTTKAVIENLALSECQGSALGIGGGSIIRNCTATNSSGGFFSFGASIFENCFVDACETGFTLGVSSIAINCTAANCSVNGFEGTASGARLENCSAVNCLGIGFVFTSGVTIDRCTARSSGRGFDIGDHSTLSNSTAISNTAQGARVGSTCTVTNNTFRLNGAGSDAAGLWVQGNGSRIESNDMTGNDWGIWVDGTDNIIIRNTARGNTAANYGSVAAGNEMAPVITGPGNFSTANYFSNFAH